MAKAKAASGDTNDQPEPAAEAAPGDEFKTWARANARWLMAELDWARAGRNAEERAVLNP